MSYECPLLELGLTLLAQVEGGAIWRNWGLPASCSLRSGLEVSREMIVLSRLAEAFPFSNIVDNSYIHIHCGKLCVFYIPNLPHTPALHSPG